MAFSQFHCLEDCCEAIDFLMKVFEECVIVSDSSGLESESLTDQEILKVIFSTAAEGLSKIVDESEGRLSLVRDEDSFLIWVGCNFCEFCVKCDIGKAWYE